MSKSNYKDKVCSLTVVSHQEEPVENGLTINAELVIRFLVKFLQDECIRRRGITKAVFGLSGGVDSAVTAFLCARAFGPKNCYAIRMPYKISSPDSLSHAQIVVDQLGCNDRIIEISQMADGYLSQFENDASSGRIGNVCARCRMVVLFDQSAKLSALPIGTGNKTERMFGYFTWHADDAPPINPLGDLFKTQVWQVAKQLDVPDLIINKPPTADLVKGQTDEGDFGISYTIADQILMRLLEGFAPKQICAAGFSTQEVELVLNRVRSTHWKRHLPTVALISATAINEFYLRPVDY